MTNLIILSAVSEAGGYTISVVGWVIVFIALILLVFIFQAIPKLLMLNIKSKLKRSHKQAANQPVNIEGNVNAAIAMALYLYLNDLHDEESNVITIRNAPKQYSPWSSKIYGVDNQPRRR